MTTRAAPAAAGLRSRPFERLLAARINVNAEVAIYAAILAAAFLLRFWDLGSRSLHHDESIHARWAWDLLQGNYRHSPIFHGPLYYHAQGLVFLVFGASDYTSRISPALFGTGLVALPLLLRSRLGAAGTVAAVAFLAFSPTVVFYSRFLREDIYMAFFTLLAVAALWRYLDDGRERWLVVFALAITGGVTTKEGTFLVVAVFLVYLDLYLASHLAAATLSARDLNTPLRRFILTGAYAPYAWIAAALWPFIAPLRRALDWDELPRSGDLLVLLGTLVLPLLTPLSRHYLLEPLGIVDKDRLNWEKSLQANTTTNDRLALAGLFTVTTSLAAFVGLQWRPRTWAIAFGASAVVYLTLMTSLWTNLDGLVSGPWGSLDYWQTQQHAYRGDQPWFYYDLLMPAYEFLPLILAIGGIWWSLVRGDAFSRFLWAWLLGLWIVLSWAGEKMPWLNTHLAVPTCIIAAYTVRRAWESWRPNLALTRPAGSLLVVAAAGMAALVPIAFLPGGVTFVAVRVLIALVAIATVGLAARPYGHRSVPAFLIAAVVGALAVFSVRTMIMASFERGDVPKDMLVYTQSSPDIPALRSEIDGLARATGRGFDLPIAVDSTDSFAWPWSWYLRDYKNVSWADMTNGPPQGDWPVLLVNTSNVGRVNDVLAASVARYGAARKYPHRWWFPENYKDAMATKQGTVCTAQSGDCGPWNVDTWKTIAEGVFRKGWLDTWFHYWRDHDPDDISGAKGDRRCNSCGSVDAFAYFPANFDTEKRVLSVKPVEPPKPTVDKSGRPAFGGIGNLPGQFFRPVDVESDGAGNLYVIDSASKKLQKFDSAGNFLAVVDIRVNPGDPAEQSEPWGLAIGPNGEVVVADTFGYRVRVFDRDLKATATFGKVPDINKPPGQFDLYGPRDAILDRNGNVWVTDTGNARVMVYTLAGQFVKELGSRGANPGQFNEPVGIAIAPDGAIYVADMYNRRVVLLDSSGAYRGEFVVQGWGGIAATDKPYLRALRDGRIALSLPSLNQVRVYGRNGDLLSTINPSDEPLSSPYGIAETADGKLWISEGGSGRLRLFAIP